MQKKCPLTGDPCYEHACEWYIQVQGTNPQTGETISEWGCTLAWLPLLLVENAKQSRETGAAVESFRNEVARGNDAIQQRLASEHRFDVPAIEIQGLMP